MQDLPDNEEKQLLVSLQIYMCYINMIRLKKKKKKKKKQTKKQLIFGNIL